MLPNLLQKPSATKTSTVIVSGAQIHTINLFYSSYFNRRHGAYLFQQAEYKTVLDSGFHAVDSGFKVLVSGFSVSGSWIPDFNHSWFFELYCGIPSHEPLWGHRKETFVKWQRAQAHTQTKGKKLSSCLRSKWGLLYFSHGFLKEFFERFTLPYSKVRFF